MNKSKLMAVLVAATVVLTFSSSAVAEPVGKPTDVKPAPIIGPVSEIDAAGEPSVKSPADFCDGEWQGGGTYRVPSWFYGGEYYAAYQDPTETGCINTYPFDITGINWFVFAQAAVTFDLQPLIYEYGGPDIIGAVLCAGPTYSVFLPASGAYLISLPLGDACCVDGPYYAGVYCATVLSFNVLDIVVDDGIVVPPRSDATYNDYGVGWLDLVDDVGFTWNLELWSEGLNSEQNLCQSQLKTLIDPDTMYAFQVHPIDTILATVYLGDFVGGHTVNDIDPASMLVNGSMTPVSWQILPSHPEFTGEVMEITIPIRDFILGYMLLWDTTIQEYTVSGQFNDQSNFSVVGKLTMIGHTSGDVNGDGVVNVADLTYLVDYLFFGDPAPPVPEAANVDGEGGVNVADLTYLVDYLFFGGPEPI